MKTLSSIGGENNRKGNEDEKGRIRKDIYWCFINKYDD